jgi:hypothetical protein
MKFAKPSALDPVLIIRKLGQRGRKCRGTVRSHQSGSFNISLRRSKTSSLAQPSYLVTKLHLVERYKRSWVMIVTKLASVSHEIISQEENLYLPFFIIGYFVHLLILDLKVHRGTRRRG